jgi:hypothetical protein
VKIYLDTCSLHRPLDNKSQLRIALEAEAVLGILAKCDAGALTLVSSEVLLVEVDRNQQPQRKAYVSSVLGQAKIAITIDDEISLRARDLEKRGSRLSTHCISPRRNRVPSISFAPATIGF